MVTRPSPFRREGLGLNTNGGMEVTFKNLRIGLAGWICPSGPVDYTLCASTARRDEGDFPFRVPFRFAHRDYRRLFIFVLTIWDNSCDPCPTSP